MKKTVWCGRVAAPIGALALVLGTALTGVPAANATGPEPPAPSASVRALLDQPGVAGVAEDSAGHTVIYRVRGQAAALDAPANSVIQELPAPITTGTEPTATSASVPTTGGGPTAVGGAGYLITSDAPGANVRAACSLGFIARSPSGHTAAITAGHCAADRGYPYVSLSRPSTDPAAGGPGWNHFGSGGFGKFGFHQFGGPGDSAGSNGSKTSVDIAVIDVTATSPTAPAVTTWAHAGSDDLARDAVAITGVGGIRQGVPVTKSGRTTGSTTATSTSYTTGWFNVSGHYVHGFGINGIVLAPGDSGGAVYQGHTAIGVTSGGSGTFEVAADLLTGLPLTGGYTVQTAG